MHIQKIDFLEKERDELAGHLPSQERSQRLMEIAIELHKARIRKENSVTAAVEKQNQAYHDQLIKLDDLQKVNQRPGTMK